MSDKLEMRYEIGTLKVVKRASSLYAVRFDQTR